MLSNTLWNGLSVGDGYAVGGTPIGPGLSLDASSRSNNGNFLNGILLDTSSQLSTSGGNLLLKGQSGSEGNASYSMHVGVYVGDNATITTGMGDLTLDGVASLLDLTQVNGGFRYGVLFHGHDTGDISLTTTTGNIRVSGEVLNYVGDQSRDNMNNAGIATFPRGSSGRRVVISSTSGDITLDADNKNDAVARSTYGMWLVSRTDILSNSGEVTISAKSGDNTAYAGLLIGSDVNIGATSSGSSSSNITLLADRIHSIHNNASIRSSGELRIKPIVDATTIGIGAAAGMLQLVSSYFSTNFVNGFSNIIIGSETAGNITVGGATTTTYHDNLTLKTAGDITMNASSSLTGASGEDASLVFWTDADGSGAGSIYLMNGSSITTYGGHLWMGGGHESSELWNGLTVGDGYAMAGSTHEGLNGSGQTNGISIDRSNINTQGGHISLKGKSVNLRNGIYIESAIMDSVGGDIDIEGVSLNNSSGGWRYGLLLGTLTAGNAVAIRSGAGDITIGGLSQGTTGNHGAGVGLYTFNQDNTLISIESTSGDISVIGTASDVHNGHYGGIFFFGNLGTERIVSQSGHISLTGTSNNSNVAGINFDSNSANSSIGYDGTNAFTGDITLNSNTFINFEGAIAANTLNLLGAGVDYTLESTQNNVNTLIANTGSVSFTNSGALELGDITTSGKMDIATQTGDLTINGNLASGSTAADAIILNAGRSVVAGTASGGNIIHQNGSITTANGGRALLYTGSVAGSTGVVNLVGSGSGNFRYNSNATTTNFTTALGNEGIFAIYREQPIINITARNDSKTVSATPYSGGNGIDITRLVNGDTESVLTGTLVYGGNSQGAIQEGTYVLTPSGLENGLGYGIAFVNGTLQITSEPTPEPASEDQSSSRPLDDAIANLPIPTSPSLQGVQFNSTSLTIPSTGSQGATAQIGSIEVIKLESGDPGSLAMLGNGNASGFLQMFVIDDGINVEGQSGQSGSNDEPSNPEVLN